MTVQPHPPTVRNVAFYVAAMAPDARRDAIKKLAVAVADGMARQPGWCPSSAADFAGAFVKAVIDALAAMPPSETRH